VGRNAIKGQTALGERTLDFVRTLETFTFLKHEVRRLRARSPGLPGVVKKLREALAAVLCAFDAGMVTVLGHKWVLANRFNY
jgi:hypothetical protein